MKEVIEGIGVVDWTIYSLTALFLVIAFFLISKRMNIFSKKSNKEQDSEDSFIKQLLDLTREQTTELKGARKDLYKAHVKHTEEITKMGGKVDILGQKVDHIDAEVKEVKEVLSSVNDNHVTKEYAEKHLVHKADLAEEVKKNMGK